MNYNNKWLLILIILSIGLGGCCRKRTGNKRNVCARNSAQNTVVDMPVAYAKNQQKTRLFDEEVNAFVLDDETDAGKEVLLSHNETDDFSWQEPDHNKTEIAHAIHFDYDSSSLSAKEKAQIAANIQMIKQQTEQGKTVVLKGHSCRSGKASGAYNLALSNNRAQKTAEILAQAGISKDRMKVFGVGYEEPLVSEDNPTKEGQAPNRRVEIYTINA